MSKRTSHVRSPREQVVEVLAVTLLDMLIRGRVGPKEHAETTQPTSSSVNR